MASRAASYPEAGSRLHVPAARLFGTIDFKPIPGIELPDGVTPSAGLRNSHDKMFALSVLSGGRALVCSNGILAGEHIISRKHTSGIDLGEAFDLALDAYIEGLPPEVIRPAPASKQGGVRVVCDVAWPRLSSSCPAV